MKQVVTALVAAAMVAAFAAGCGSSSSSTSSDTSAAELSTTEFLKQGNAICQAGNKDLNKGARQAFSGGKPSQKEIDRYVNDVAVPSIQGQIDDIRALNAPASLDAKVNDFLDQAQSALDKVKNDPSLMENGQVFADVNKLGNDIGLTACGS